MADRRNDNGGKKEWFKIKKVQTFCYEEGRSLMCY